MANIDLGIGIVYAGVAGTVNSFGELKVLSATTGIPTDKQGVIDLILGPVGALVVSVGIIYYGGKYLKKVISEKDALNKRIIEDLRERNKKLEEEKEKRDKG